MGRKRIVEIYQRVKKDWLSNMKKMTQKSRIRWHVMLNFGWHVGKIFTIEGLYRKLNGLGINDDNYSTNRYFRVSRSTVRRAIDDMLESGEIEVVKKSYNCYDRIQYRVLETYPF